eukprot:18884-Heterococcus_DN1.PRE.2
MMHTSKLMTSLDRVAIATTLTTSTFYQIATATTTTTTTDNANYHLRKLNSAHKQTSLRIHLQACIHITSGRLTLGIVLHKSAGAPSLRALNRSLTRLEYYLFVWSCGTKLSAKRPSSAASFPLLHLQLYYQAQCHAITAQTQLQAMLPVSVAVLNKQSNTGLHYKHSFIICAFVAVVCKQRLYAAAKETHLVSARSLQRSYCLCRSNSLLQLTQLCSAAARSGS